MAKKDYNLMNAVRLVGIAAFLAATTLVSANTRRADTIDHIDGPLTIGASRQLVLRIAMPPDHWRTAPATVTIADKGGGDIPKRLPSDLGTMMPQPAAGFLISGGLTLLVVFAILRLWRISRPR